MKRFMTIVSVLAILAFAGSAFAGQYGWTISSDATNPDVNSSTLAPGIATLYLWFQCNDDDGMSAAEFDVAGNGFILPLAFTTMSGYLNAGSPTALLLAVGGCPSGPVVAGNWLCQVLAAGGDLCLVPSAANGINGTVDCQASPSLFDNEYRGFSDGGVPCESRVDLNLCETVSVEDESWGSIKGLYR